MFFEFARNIRMFQPVGSWSAGGLEDALSSQAFEKRTAFSQTTQIY